MRKRRSLTHVGGTTRTAGDPAVAAKLADALDVAPAPEPGARRGTGALEGEVAGGDARASGGGDAGREDDPDRVHVHGFHTYPARMHPVTASRLVRALSGEGSTVLDPFCGSGTVLVEALIAGRRAVGADLNPLAVRLARAKTALHDAATREALVGAAREIAGFADQRRRQRAGATRRYPPDDVAHFEPHVLLELDSLRAGITGLEDARLREALSLVLSAILVKVSRRTSDTSTTAVARRIAAGYPARLFVKKTEELARRLAALEALLPPGAAPARVEVDDATRLRTVPPATIDAVVTSPPYAATYDYLAHHALRLRWLDLDARGLADREMGSRRRYAALDPQQARDAWSRELGATLRALSRACRKGATVALLLADSAVAGEALRADVLVTAAADTAGFRFVARASQPRPHFHGPTVAAFDAAPRGEHAVALEKR
jgi:hypothetical protein